MDLRIFKTLNPSNGWLLTLKSSHSASGSSKFTSVMLEHSWHRQWHQCDPKVFLPGLPQISTIGLPLKTYISNFGRGLCRGKLQGVARSCGSEFLSNMVEHLSTSNLANLQTIRFIVIYKQCITRLAHELCPPRWDPCRTHQGWWEPRAARPRPASIGCRPQLRNGPGTTIRNPCRISWNPTWRSISDNVQ
jgi:hypothetical protein